MKQLSFDFFNDLPETPVASDAGRLKKQPLTPDAMAGLKKDVPSEKNDFLLTPSFTYHLERAKRKTVGFIVDERGVTVRAPRWVSVS